MKKYDFERFDDVYAATKACNENQQWHVVNIFPRTYYDIIVVYYTFEE